MKANKYSLVIIILLLVITLPLTVMGYIYKQNHKVDENKNHEMYYKGKIWFYNNSGELLGTYECKTEVCELAKSTIDDEEYKLDYYKDGEKDIIDPIEDSYAFIQDGDYVYLYSIHNSKSIQEYLKVKNYSNKVSDGIFIIQDKNNKWGVLYISSNIEAMIPFEYDFIGLKNELDSDNKLVSNKFIVKQDENWYLVDTVNKKLTSSFDYPIYDYNDKVVVLYNDTYMLYDYEAKRLVPSLNIEKYMFENSYTGIISNNKLYIYYVWQNGPVKVYDINSNSNIKLEYKDYKIYVYDNDNLLDSFN